jgi:hypothetical protein
MFIVDCVSGTKTANTFTVNVPSQSYSVTANDSAWIPSGDQSNSLVYQGLIAVPDVFRGSTVRLDAGGTFSATLS